MVKKLQDKKLVEQNIFDELRDPSKNLDLLSLKDLGKLTIPSATIHSLYAEIEKCVRLYEKELLNPKKRTFLEGEIINYLEEDTAKSILLALDLIELIVPKLLSLRL